jgi:Chaperone of endosialidase
MGGSGNSGGSTTTVKNELSPEQRQIMQNTMGKYMPNGELESRPNYTPAQATARGNERVAGFNTDQTNAFQKTRDIAYQHQPAMDSAASYAQAGAAPTGTKTGLGAGWTTTPGTGGGRPTSTFEDFTGSAVTRRMNPFQQQVIDQTVDQSNQGRLLQRNSDNQAAAQGGGWGSRHAVREGVTNQGYDSNLQQTLANLNTQNYNQAQTQYNTDRQVGMGQIAGNNQIDDVNAARASSGAMNITNVAKERQMLDGKGTDAIGKVGDAIQGRDQQVLSTGYADLNQEHTYGLQIAQALSGFTPAPTTTQTTQNNTGSSAIWGSLLGSAAMALPMMMGGSDERIKTNIKKADPEDALKEIRKLAAYTYDYNDHAKATGQPDGRRTGFMAQDLEKATGREAPTMPGGYKGVDLFEHLGRLTHAVQALDSKVNKKPRSSRVSEDA